MALNATNATSLGFPSGAGEIIPWLTGSLWPWILHFITQELGPRIQQILFEPLVQRQMLWVLVPLMTTMVLMTFYFGVHKSESLGWNTAFGNSLVLIFTSINLLQLIYGDISLEKLVVNQDTAIAVALLAEGIFLMFLNFFHFLPERLAFYLASPLHVNVLAMFGVIIVYSPQIQLDWVTSAALFVMYVTVGIALSVFKAIIPGVREQLEAVTDQSYMDILNSQDKKN